MTTSGAISSTGISTLPCLRIGRIAFCAIALSTAVRLTPANSAASRLDSNGRAARLRAELGVRIGLSVLREAVVSQ
jgi:hypothetical protein